MFKRPAPARPQKFALTLEQLLTKKEFWGLETATSVQRAKCRILEGLPVGEELANDPYVLEMCNGTIPTNKRPPSELLDISAIRIGKSLFAGCALFWMAQKADLSTTRDSDIINLFVVALTMSGTAAVIKHLIEPMLSKPLLRAYLADDPAEISVKWVQRNGLRIKRPHDGRIVEIKCIPLDKGGGSAVSVYCAGLVVDEYPRMNGAADGVKNVEHFREAVAGRMLPGACAIYTGSPWHPYGPAYDMVANFFGKPDEDLVVLRTNAKPFIGLGHWTPERVALLQRKAPATYNNDFLALFRDGEEAVFPAGAIDDAVLRPRLHDAVYGRPAIFADPSALRHDYWAALVGGWVYPVPDPEDLYQTEELGERISDDKPIRRGTIIAGKNGWVRILEDAYGRRIPRAEPKVAKPHFEVYEIVSWDKDTGARGTDLVKAVGALGRKYDCQDFHWDGYEQLMLGDLIRQEGLRPVVHSWTGQGRKTEAVDHLRTLFVEKRVKIPNPAERPPLEDPTKKTPEAMLKQELVRFRQKATPGGNFQYVVAGGAGHGDHASCLTLASRADLDGFVDRSPTARPTRRVEIPDHTDNDSEMDAA